MRDGDQAVPDSLDAELAELFTDADPTDTTQGRTSTRGARSMVPLALLAVTAAVVVAVLAVAGPFRSTPAPTVSAAAVPQSVDSSATAAEAVKIVSARHVDPAQLDALTEATTFTTVVGAPADPAPSTPPNGIVLHPSRKIAAYASPGGPAIASIPPQQLGSDTWLPVVAEQPGWVQVMLPSRPNNSTAWVALGGEIALARTPFYVLVDRTAFRLTLIRDGQQVGQWTVGIGKPSAITPAGRTFILASIKDTKQTFSAIVIPLGAHSDTHQTYGGGPGTVGVHGWPSADVFGQASSDGCVRVPADALQILSTEVPLGTPVVVT